MKTLILSSALLTIFAFTSIITAVSQQNDTYVYVCNGKSSKKYHVRFVIKKTVLNSNPPKSIKFVE